MKYLRKHSQIPGHMNTVEIIIHFLLHQRVTLISLMYHRNGMEVSEHGILGTLCEVVGGMDHEMKMLMRLL